MVEYTIQRQVILGPKGQSKYLKDENVEQRYFFLIMKALEAHTSE